MTYGKLELILTGLITIPMFLLSLLWIYSGFILPGVGLLAWAVFLLYILWRNHKVYEFRKKILDDSHDEYLALPPYSTMVWRFWKPLESFRRNVDKEAHTHA